MHHGSCQYQAVLHAVPSVLFSTTGFQQAVYNRSAMWLALGSGHHLSQTRTPSLITKAPLHRAPGTTVPLVPSEPVQMTNKPPAWAVLVAAVLLGVPNALGEPDLGCAELEWGLGCVGLGQVLGGCLSTDQRYGPRFPISSLTAPSATHPSNVQLTNPAVERSAGRAPPAPPASLASPRSHAAGPPLAPRTTTAPAPIPATT